jgi:hypothetical protein
MLLGMQMLGMENHFCRAKMAGVGTMAFLSTNSYLGLRKGSVYAIHHSMVKVASSRLAQFRKLDNCSVMVMAHAPQRLATANAHMDTLAQTVPLAHALSGTTAFATIRAGA